MQTEIVEFVKEKRSGKRQRVGCFVGIKHGDEVTIGWSRANVKIDKFDEGKAFQIAEGRANSTKSIMVPHSFKKRAVRFSDRCKRFFKGMSVRSVIESDICSYKD